MTSGDLTRLRRAYGDICRGYSEEIWNDRPVYIKHLTVFDQTEIDTFYERVLDKNIERGLYTEKSRLDYLMAHGIWTKEDELSLRQQEDFVQNLHKTKSKIALKVQLDQINKQIVNESNKLNKLTSKRTRLLGLTAEKTADEQTQYEYIRVTFFQDREFKNPLFSKQDMEELTDEDSRILLYLYIRNMQRFDNKTVRAISVQPFFANSFYLCKDNFFSFFGKPMAELSIYQTNLLMNGQYYRSILSNHDVPNEIMQDPDKLEDYVNRSKNMKSVVDKASVSKGGRVGLVGAVAEDFATIGVKDGTNDMRQAAQKQYKSGREGAKDLGFTYTN